MSSLLWRFLRLRSASIVERSPQRAKSRHRRVCLEALESRQMLTTSVPYGALPSDTGEFMLGDVYVNVVLMQSDPTMAPFDKSTETWTQSEIDGLRGRIESGVNWWSNLLGLQPNVRPNQLTFTFDWSHGATPAQAVHTGYEPINRTSDEWILWGEDFLTSVGYAKSGTDINGVLEDLRDYNNAQRIAHNANWSYTIFVANDANSTSKTFASGGSFSRSFAYAGGNAFIMPEDRPAEVVAHETGHMFWALDEYTGTSAQANRGYYDTYNNNSVSNTDPAHTHVASIMSGQIGATYEPSVAFAGNSTSPESMQMVGWKFSDSSGIPDVLNVKMGLDGDGQFNTTANTFHFIGTSWVRTLKNKNPSGLGDDITINRIRQVEYSVDGGSWTTINGAANNDYIDNLDVTFPITAGASQVKIRTEDTRTGVLSDEYVANLGSSMPLTSTRPGVNGYVYSDANRNSTWNNGEVGLANWLVQFVDNLGNAINYQQQVAIANFADGTVLNSVTNGVALSVTGLDSSTSNVFTRTSTSAPSAGKVFGNKTLAGVASDTWTSGRELNIAFTIPTTTVSLTAYGFSPGSVGRLEIYDASNHLLDRYTTGALSAGQSQVMTLSRPQADIAYAIAYGHAGTQVVLTGLKWGVISSTYTDSFGAFSLSTAPAGTYRVQAVAPQTNFIPVSPPNGVQVVTFAGPSAQNIDFGFYQNPAPWQNPVNPLDVNGNGSVSSPDVLVLVNDLNSNHIHKVVGIPTTTNTYLDVNGDGNINTTDVLILVNYINSHPVHQTASGEAPLSGAGGGFTKSSSTASGEQAAVLPTSGEGEFFAGNSPSDLADGEPDDAPANKPIIVAPVPSVPVSIGGLLSSAAASSTSTAAATTGGKPTAAASSAASDSPSELDYLIALLASDTTKRR